MLYGLPRHTNSLPDPFWILRATGLSRFSSVDNNSTRRLAAAAGAFAHRIDFRTWMRLIDDSRGLPL